MRRHARLAVPSAIVSTQIPPMHPRLQELSDHFDRHRADLRAAVNSVPTEQHERAPSDGEWSVLGVLEHIAIVEGRVSAALQRTIDQARANGVSQETDDAPLLTTLGADVYLDRTKKIKASEAAQPKLAQSIDAIWRSLDETRDSIRGLMTAADGMKLTDVTMPHPVFGPLHLYKWFAFVGAHEGRHAAQIREIGARLAEQPHVST